MFKRGGRHRRTGKKPRGRGGREREREREREIERGELM